MKPIHIIIAVVLDLLIGDPYEFFHPVKEFGRWIQWEERWIRQHFVKRSALRWAGLFMVIINGILAFGIPFLFLRYTEGWVKEILLIYGIYTCLSLRMLQVESMKVYDALSRSLVEGRHRLSYIVGRDTEQLSESEVIAATVETVAENTSDGGIAPLFYLFLLGLPGGMLYKMVNTMDSMVGYHNEKYEDLGFFPAKTDDLLNYIPARITALAFLFVGLLTGKSGWKVFLRDRKNHLSPNAGYPEAAIAGILGVQLGGGHYYFGTFVEKPTIGDPVYSLHPNHIKKTIKYMYGAFCSVLFIGLALYAII